MTESRSGFTLIEMVVVLAVIALLAALVGPQIVGRVSEARGTSAKAQIELFSTALENYRLDNGGYPTTSQGLAALRTKPASAPIPFNWRGPYLRKAVPADPWGKPYQYRSSVDGAPFEVASYGRDGRPGGVGEDADINSR
ncbi:MAG: type II secretion system major pseudopilin GspG [Gemmatimonadaceae bacterium]|nr:type II secretion system major pseudopilin GspG [Gemmatimonadaceae bacterium]